MKDGSIILTHGQRGASVAYLPTAKLEPVKNPMRRGRLPKGVVAMGKPREVVSPVQQPPGAMDPMTAMARMIDLMQCTLDMTRQRLAEYEKAQRRTG
ncbi:hypothetical protein [Achromobacter sp.]|uniref:hypothetical protein n=1 Tax=Achromobacter sp. TaxID=134375 RepID=UPI000EE1C28A|nr:hypothetical protein [Achromobacter sp.]HCW16871.1 hypothetical protein [Achromobacter sp.]